MIGGKSYEVEKKAVPVKAYTVNGQQLRGNLMINREKDLSQVLNGPDDFLELETASGTQYISCRSLITIQLNDVPVLPQLNSKVFVQQDPYAILNLSRGVSMEEARKAYHALLKIYHPDRFASMDLPQEFVDYARAMSARINWAYQEIKESMTQGVGR
jgi:DnaJ-domain-containing protein 1